MKYTLLTVLTEAFLGVSIALNESTGLRQLQLAANTSSWQALLRPGRQSTLTQTIHVNLGTCVRSKV